MDPFDPAGVRFWDVGRHRELLLVEVGPWAGWICYRHPDGQWVSLRKATEADLQCLHQARVARELMMQLKQKKAMLACTRFVRYFDGRLEPRD